MFHLDNTSGVPEMPEVKALQSNTPRWFGESESQGGISWPGADWFNIIQYELLNVLNEAGVTPEKHSFSQLSEAIQLLIKNAFNSELGAKIVGYGSSTVYDELRIHGVTTSSFGVGQNNISDTITDHTLSFAKMVATERFIIVDTVINLSASIETQMDHQRFSSAGIGVIRPIGSAMATKAMINVVNEHVIFDRASFDNPSLLKAQSGGRQGAICVKADYFSCIKSTFRNQLNAIVGDSRSSPHGGKILDNWFFDCIGAGDGPSNLTSNYGEDRGDAVSWWGSGVIISGNHAYCKTGEDARTAFFVEYPVTTPTNPRDDLDRMNVVVIGNFAYGSFRRHFALEGITNAISANNVSAGGGDLVG